MYNRLAGSSVERLAALSDGIFAVGMTLLVLDLHVPEPATVHGEGAVWRTLSGLAPQLVTYLMSFLTLGIFWNGQQVQLNHLARSDRHLAWINLAFLFAVTLMPFSTRLLAEYIRYRVALVCYWANIFMLGGLLLAAWRYAKRAGLTTREVTDSVNTAVERRIIWAQTLYAVCAAMCAINTYVSIALIVLVQLNFAIAPRIRGLPQF